MDTLMSMDSFEQFKGEARDFSSTEEEVERHRVLTIKGNRPTHNKKVKGQQNNIFSSENSHPLANNAKPSAPKRKLTQEKTEEELMVPELILSVKPIRKG